MQEPPESRVFESTAPHETGEDATRRRSEQAGERQVLIVGGGLGGLTLAGLLRNRGANPVVVERSLHGDRRHGVVLAEPALDVLADLGLASSVRDAGRWFRSWTLCRPETAYVERSLPDDARPTSLLVRYDHVRDHLRETLPASTVVAGKTPTAFDQSRPGVEVEFDDGVRERFDVVVGADGPHSRVRRATTGEDDARPGVTTSWTFGLGTDVGTPTDVTETWVGEETAFACLDTGREYRGHLVTRSTSGSDDATAGQRSDFPDDVLEAALADAACLPQSAVETVSVEDVRRRQVGRGQSPVWWDRRLALLGDAAHPMHPLSAVSATLAVEDAAALADALGRGDGLSDALAGYAARCRRRLAALDDASASRPAESVEYPATSLAADLRDAVARRSRLFETSVSGGASL